jgi:hypothetical protein
MPRAEADRYGSGGLLVFDTSAWNRQQQEAVLARWLATEEADLLVVCPVVALELLAAARDEQKFADLDRTLSALPMAPVTRSVGIAALGAWRGSAALRPSLRPALPRARNRERLDRGPRLAGLILSRRSSLARRFASHPRRPYEASSVP